MPFDPNRNFEIEGEGADNELGPEVLIPGGGGFNPNRQFEAVPSGPSPEQVRSMSPIPSEPYAADRADLNFEPSEAQSGSPWTDLAVGTGETLEDVGTLLKVPVVQPALEMVEDYVIGDPLRGATPGTSHRERLAETVAAQKRSPIAATLTDAAGYLTLPASPTVAAVSKIGGGIASKIPSLTNLALTTNGFGKFTKAAVKGAGRVLDESAVAGMDTLFKEEDVPRSVANAFMAGAVQSGMELGGPLVKATWKQFKKAIPATEMTSEAVNGIWAKLSHTLKSGQNMSADDMAAFFSDYERRRKVKIMNTSTAQAAGNTMARSTIDTAKELKKARDQFATAMSREYGQTVKPFLDVKTPLANYETEKALAGLRGLMDSVERKSASYTSPVKNTVASIKQMLEEGLSKEGTEGLTYFQIYDRTAKQLAALKNPTTAQTFAILQKEHSDLLDATGYMKENLLAARRRVSNLLYGKDPTVGVRFEPGRSDKALLVKMRNHIDSSLKNMTENADALIKADDAFHDYKDVFSSFDRILGPQVRPSALRTGLKSSRETGEKFRGDLKDIAQFIDSDPIMKQAANSSGLTKAFTRIEDLLKDLDMERMIEQSQRTMGPSSSRGAFAGAGLIGLAVYSGRPELMFLMAPLIDPYAYTNIVDALATTKGLNPSQLKGVTTWWERTARNAADKYPELLTHLQRQIRIFDRPSRERREETADEKTVTSSLSGNTGAMPTNIVSETEVFEAPSQAVRDLMSESKVKTPSQPEGEINADGLRSVETNKGVYFPKYNMSVPSLPDDFPYLDTKKQKGWLIKNGQNGKP